MAQPVEIFKNIKGMTRDFAVDSLPSGYLWDLVDAVPNRKGARIDQRGAWSYFSTAYPASIWGGYHAAFTGGQKLLIVANSQVWDVNQTTGSGTAYGAGPAKMVQNGVKLNDRVYFMDGTGAMVPTVVTYSAAGTALPASAPKAKVGIPYKGRLVLAGDPANPSRVSFSPLEDDGGPPAAWDAEAWIGTNNEVTGLAAMAGQILVFHPAAVERIRGSIPPGTNIEVDDMFTETLTEQVGCTLPHTIVPWRENIIFADERGVFLTDGSTVRNLAELGGIGDFWRLAYGNRITDQGVSAGIFLDYLLITVNASVSSTAVNFTLVCDLNTRSWFRFTNFPATCYIQSEAAMEQCWVGHLGTNRLARVSTMFMDPVPTPSPAPDYIDGNGLNVLPSFTTGFERLDKEEGLTRLRSIYTSYHHQSFVRSEAVDGVRVEYRTDPPDPLDIDPITGAVTGWVQAGNLPDALLYTRKKMPVGRRGYGIMVRISALTSSRVHRFFSVGVERTSQDRAKVTT
jgi:hypothetical protein